MKGRGSCDYCFLYELLAGSMRSTWLISFITNFARIFGLLQAMLDGTYAKKKLDSEMRALMKDVPLTSNKYSLITTFYARNYTARPLGVILTSYCACESYLQLALGVSASAMTVVILTSPINL